MVRIGKILFPTDFSECANQALPYALFFARHFQAELHMLHCIDFDRNKPYGSIAHHIDTIEESFPAIYEEIDRRMDDAIKSHSTEDIKIVRAHVQEQYSSDAILAYCDDNDIDLIVMGTHGRRGLGYAFLGSVASEVVRLANCPVLTIRQKREYKPFIEDGHILVPVDFSEHSIKALQYACEIAIKYKARLDIIHVLEEVTYPQAYGVAKGITKIMKEKSLKELLKICDKIVGSKVPYYTYAIAGNSPYEILNFAEKNGSELIVISTHGLTGLKHFLIGSVADKVVRRAPCPVFTVKAFGKSLI